MPAFLRGGATGSGTATGASTPERQPSSGSTAVT